VQPPAAQQTGQRSLLDLIFSKITSIVLASSGVFATLAIVALVIWRRSNPAALPYFVWLVILALLAFGVGLIEYMLRDRPGGLQAPERQRLVGLIGLGLTGFALVGLGLTLPFVNSEVFGAPLTTWRQHMVLVLTVGGLLLGGFFLMVLGLQLGREISREYPNVRRSVAGYNSAVGTILLVGILVIVNLLPYIQFEPFLSLNRSYDWTTSQMFSLEDASKNTLADLKEPVKVDILMPAQFPPTHNVETLLTAARGITSKVSYEVVSPQLNPELFENLRDKYKIKDDYGMLVLYGTEPKVSHEFIPIRDIVEVPDASKERKFLFKGESALMNAINYLREGKSKIKVYFTQGHGEPDFTPQQFGRNPRSFGILKEEMEKRNYVAEPFTFERGKALPADADLVVIGGPQMEFDTDAIKVLRDYVNGVGRQKKGRLIVLMPQAADNRGTPIKTNLEPFLAEFHVKVGKDRILTLGPPQYPVFIIGDPVRTNPIGQTFLRGRGRPTFVFYTPRTVTPLRSEDPGRQVGGYTAEDLLVAQPDMGIWAETNIESNPVDMVDDLLQHNPDALKKKLSRTPLSLAVTVTEGKPSMPPMPGHPPIPNDAVPRMVVFGDATWATDELLSSGLRTRHLDLFFSCGAWLREKPDIGSTAAPKERSQYSLPMPSDGGWRLVLLPVALALLAVIMLGGAVAIVRRR
jgi:hypothetical protein